MTSSSTMTNPVSVPVTQPPAPSVSKADSIPKPKNESTQAKPPRDWSQCKKISVSLLMCIFGISTVLTFLSFVCPEVSILHQHYLFAAAAVAGVALIALGALVIKKFQESKVLVGLGALLALAGAAAIITGLHAGLDVAFQGKPYGINPQMALLGVFGCSAIGLAATVSAYRKLTK